MTKLAKIKRNLREIKQITIKLVIKDGVLTAHQKTLELLTIKALSDEILTMK